jgi:hypothetical protein
VQLGNPKIAERNGAVADAYAEGLREVVAPLARLPGRPARAIAAALNDQRYQDDARRRVALDDGHTAAR